MSYKLITSTKYCVLVSKRIAAKYQFDFGDVLVLLYEE
jgi:hypothetical protein